MNDQEKEIQRLLALLPSESMVLIPKPSSQVYNGSTYYVALPTPETVHGYCAAEVEGRWVKSVAQVSLAFDPIVYVQVKP